jgi:peptidoglycan/LPS O-acetylase OafA/YrhL
VGRPVTAVPMDLGSTGAAASRAGPAAPASNTRVDEAGDGFGVMRIAAAIMVILAHSFPLARGAEDPTWQRGDVIISFGSAAVSIFFVISGYLVLSSWMRDPNPFRFAARRVARIWPGLLVMLIVTTWILGSAVTTLPLARYLTDAGTLRYFAGSAILLPVWDLPGVFQTNPGPGVNGSIWTLPIEVTAYSGLALLGPLLLVRGRRRLIRALVTAAAIVVGVALTRFGLPHPMVVGLAYLVHQNFLVFFIGGGLLYLGRYRVPMRLPLFGLALIGLLGALTAGIMIPVFVFMSYGVIYLSTRRAFALRRLTALGDPSYGIYIYAYPIQQLLAHLRLAPNEWVLFVEATVLSVVVGYLSWHLVEQRALEFARRRLRRRAASVISRPKPLAAA